MKTALKAVCLATLGLAALPVFAQSTYPPSDSWRMPYQKEFWTTGHIGAQLGRANLDIGCPATFSCDDNATALKVFAGGRFNNIFGGEISYLRTGDFERTSPLGSSDINMQALNFGLLAGVPFGPGRNSSVFAKLGLLWGHTEVGSASQNGWGPSYGLGATVGLTRNWALRLDWDRYRFKLPAGGGDRENIDAFLIGAQLTLGNPR